MPYPSAHPLPNIPEPAEEFHQEPRDDSQEPAKELHQASGIFIHHVPEEDAHQAPEPAAEPDPELIKRAE